MTKKYTVDWDDIPIQRKCINTAFYKLLQSRISRRKLLINTGLLSTNLTICATTNAKKDSSIGFTEISHGLDERLHVAAEYSHQVLLKWGDPIFKHAPKFDPFNQTPHSQKQQFGYNNDFVTYIPLQLKENSSEHGLLVVNHEYVNSSLMHSGSPKADNLNKLQIDTEIFAHGLSIVEIQKQKDTWQVILESNKNRRITPHTGMIFSGPAAGHRRLRTSFAPDGKQCIGTFANCAGGVTPWGTVLTAEENVQAYFMGQAKNTNEYSNYKRFGLLGDRTALSIWGKYHERWNLDKHPQVGNHAGWIVEIDPFDPNFTPIKRTALGRCKHEGCDVVINKDGRVVVYMGDDQAYEYVYRFISKEKYRPGNKKHNMSLLDEGELAVAEFNDQGTVTWHPLVWGRNPHIKQNGFNSQADVVIEARRAADLVGATPMDRPEEIKVNPVSGNVFAVFTNNIRRGPLQTDAANPRVLNRHGHILELIPPKQDHSAREYQWEVFLLAGDPQDKLDQAFYHTELSKNGWFSCPDNCSFDHQGNLWIATDGFYRFGHSDGIWVCATQSDNKALCKHFLRAPREAEICSPCFTPDHKTMFCSVQHPGDDSSFDQPTTRWPDFDNNMPPRPAVIAVTHKQGKVIGN